MSIMDNAVLLVDRAYYLKDLTPEELSSNNSKQTYFPKYVFETMQEMKSTYIQAPNLTKALENISDFSYKMIALFCLTNDDYHRAAIFFHQYAVKIPSETWKVIMIHNVSIVDGKTPSNATIIQFEDQASFRSLLMNKRESNKPSNSSALLEEAVDLKPLKSVSSLVPQQVEASRKIQRYDHLITHDDFRRTGDTLNDKYRLVGFIGAGGMGWVYLATDQSGNYVAIKLLKPEVVSRNPKNVHLFENEFRAASNLVHPNIVRIFDSGTDEYHRISYMVMEVLDGITIDEFLSKQQMPIEMLEDIFRQICDAIQYAHSKNVLHLDIKPANILLLRKDAGGYQVKVIDFGMSKVISSESGTTVTQFGGSLQFCSPEHFGGKLTYRSDIYSLGATLYYMLAGVIPFGASYINAKQHPNLEMPPIPSIMKQRPDLPKGLDVVVQKTISKNPLDRQLSARNLYLEFEAALQNSRNKAVPTISVSSSQRLLPGPKIKVIGVGGGGSNAVDHMIKSGIRGVEFIVVNTDVQSLSDSKAPVRIQLGSKLTRGLGAGADPNIGRDAALEDHEKLLDALEGADMVFITAGLGGGTGTGAAPVIASLAIELGALTVAVVTKPFSVEGKSRMAKAEKGLAELRGCVDTIITIPNSKLIEFEGKIRFADAFYRADDILLQVVQGISDLVTVPGKINLDFADVKAIMRGMGVALIGIGTARGENAALTAMENAINSRILERNSIEGAKGVLINITCSNDVTLDDINQSLSLIEERADEDANIIFGTVFDNSEEAFVKITVIATGFDSNNN